jgi:ubiquitin-conjugating enzyme E2 D/E
MSKRLSTELKKMLENPPENCSAGIKNENNLYHWEATIIGPENTPYHGGVFMLDIDIPNDYPFKPPKVQFITKIYHPNISRTGSICVDILKDSWSPALDISQVLISITSLLSDPNPKDPLEPDIAKEFLSNKEEYYNNVKSWIKIYATTGTDLIN